MNILAKDLVPILGEPAQSIHKAIRMLGLETYSLKGKIAIPPLVCRRLLERRPSSLRRKVVSFVNYSAPDNHEEVLLDIAKYSSILGLETLILDLNPGGYILERLYGDEGNLMEKKEDGTTKIIERLYLQQFIPLGYQSSLRIFNRVGCTAVKDIFARQARKDASLYDLVLINASPYSTLPMDMYHQVTDKYVIPARLFAGPSKGLQITLEEIRKKNPSQHEKMYSHCSILDCSRELNLHKIHIIRDALSSGAQINQYLQENINQRKASALTAISHILTNNA